ncbi:MAG: phosphoribosylanthranilate isomerase [Alphaproteobacteria bacterium]|nr:phosphoribosylanthranilate isomerase [Alphaproteobacteria bacterium]
MTVVKICGLTNESDVESAIAAGADRLGFVVVAASPRFVDFETARRLIRLALDHNVEPWVVAGWSADRPASQSGLDRFLEEILDLGAVQLHGGERPADVADFARRFPLMPMVKALGVSSRRDLERIKEFPGADGFLFDARPPAGATREGGFGKAFDWSILQGFDPGDHRDWVLSGGLTPENVASAIGATGASAVDVSSGVESAPGVKDHAKVAAFIQSAKAAA